MKKFIDEVVRLIHDATGLDEDEIRKSLALCSDEDMGDIGFPCFKLARELGKSPHVVAAELAERLQRTEGP